MNARPSAKRRHTMRLPELGTGGATVRVSMWLVEEGAEVTEGDRLIEIAVSGATIDLPAPISGRLVELCVDEDEPITRGQVLAVLEADEMP